MATPSASPHTSLIFLSHSASDKPYVERVIKGLPSSHIFYDIATIDPGSLNIEAMERSVASCDVFILFLSPAADASVWVQYESSVARITKIRQPRLQVLVVPLGGLTYRDAPDWMHAYFSTTPEYLPRDVARTIWGLLQKARSASGTIRQEIFIGREQLCNETIVEYMTRSDRNQHPTNFLVLAGLTQVGRASLARHLLPRLYPDARVGGPIFDLPPYADALDFFLRLRDEIDDSSSLDKLRRTTALFNSFGVEEAANAIFANLSHYARLNQWVVVHSSYGLRATGYDIKPWAAHLIGRMMSQPNMRVVWISERLLTPEVCQEHSNMLQVYVPELSDTSIFLIMQELLGLRGISVQSLQDIAKRAGGHAGTAYHAAKLIQDGQRSPEALIARKEDILAFQEKVLNNTLEQAMRNEPIKSILTLLSVLPSCDFRTICASFSDRKPSEIADAMDELVGFCLVTYDLTSGYKTPEIVRIVVRDRGMRLSEDVLSRLKTHMRERILGDEVDIQDVELLIFLYAAFDGEVPNELSDLILPSNLVEIVNFQRAIAFKCEQGDDAKRHYQLAAKFAQLACALEMDDGTREELLYLGGDALVRGGEDPTPIVDEMLERKMSAAHIVLGSYHLYQDRRYPEAERHLEIAWNANVKRQRTTRLLAKAILRQGRRRAGDALKAIDRLGKRRVQSDSNLLLERVRCLQALGREPEVKETLERIEALNEGYGDYDIFRANQCLNHGEYPEAERFVRLAANKPRTNKLQLALIDCAIKIAKGDSSRVQDTCARLVAAGRRMDACQLLARAALAAGDWRAAEKEMEQIDKKNYYDLYVMHGILSKKYDDPMIQADPVVMDEVSELLSSIEEQMADRSVPAGRDTLFDLW